MTEAELLKKVKIGLFGSDEGTWRDELLTIYIDEVKDFLRSAGVKETLLQSEAIVGCVILGVNDLWNYQSGGAELSDYVKRRAIQLAMSGENI